MISDGTARKSKLTTSKKPALRQRLLVEVTSLDHVFVRSTMFVTLKPIAVAFATQSVLFT